MTIFRVHGYIDTFVPCNIYIFSRHVSYITLYGKYKMQIIITAGLEGITYFFFVDMTITIIIGVYNPTYNDVCVWAFTSRRKL
jgi:hypothetical protein